MDAIKRDIAGHFGARLRGLRRAKGLTLQVVADRCRVTKGYLSLVENARVNPPAPDVVRRIARVVGQEPEAFLALAYLNRAPRDLRDSAGGDTGGLGRVPVPGGAWVSLPGSLAAQGFAVPIGSDDRSAGIAGPFGAGDYALASATAPLASGDVALALIDTDEGPRRYLRRVTLGTPVITLEAPGVPPVKIERARVSALFKVVGRLAVRS